jgi:hypothetical protein
MMEYPNAEPDSFESRFSIILMKLFNQPSQTIPSDTLPNLGEGLGVRAEVRELFKPDLVSSGNSATSNVVFTKNLSFRREKLQH